MKTPSRFISKVAAGFVSLAIVTAPPFGIGECHGVRPGGFLVTDGALCTFNFLFKGSDGNRYAGTAGHCFDDTVAELRV